MYVFMCVCVCLQGQCMSCVSWGRFMMLWVFTYVCLFVCMYVCMYVCNKNYLHSACHTYACIYTHINAYTHTHTHSQRSSCYMGVYMSGALSRQAAQTECVGLNGHLAATEYMYVCIYTHINEHIHTCNSQVTTWAYT
jgi:hypothetical protein